MKEPAVSRLPALIGVGVCSVLALTGVGAVTLAGPDRALTSNLAEETVTALTWTVLAAVWVLRGRPSTVVLVIAAAWGAAAATGGMALLGAPFSVVAGWVCTWSWGIAVGLSYTLGVLRAARWRSSPLLEAAALLSVASMAVGFATLPTVMIEEGVEHHNPFALPASPLLSMVGGVLTACTAFAAIAFLALQLTTPARRRMALPVLVAAIAGIAGIGVGVLANEWSHLVQALTLPLLPLAISVSAVGTASRTLRSVGAQLDGAASPSNALSAALAEITLDLGLPGSAIEVGGKVVASVGEAGTQRLPLVNLGRVEGFLLTPKLTEDAEAEVNTVAPSIAAVLSSVRLVEEVRRSRAELAVAREEERRRVRHDLHDEVGPLLAAVVAQTDVMSLTLGRSPERARESLEKARSASAEAVMALRRIARDLHPLAVDNLGVAAALDELASGLSGETRVSATAMTLPQLPAAVEVALYRIAAEAAGNAVRHAGASSVDIQLMADDGAVLLAVVDDGNGFNPDRITSGVGLTSMRRRAAELDGKLSIMSSAAGTAIRARIPVPT